MTGTAERMARAWLWKAAVPLALPMLAALTLLIPLAVLAAAATPTASASSACSTAGTGATVAGIELDAVQMGHAQTIVTVGAARGLNSYAATVALATAWQESRLRMLANDGSSPELTPAQAAETATSLTHPHDGLGSDHDSVNTFQQRWTAGWGTVAQLMDPVYAAEAFYTRLVAVPDWEAIPLTRAAQAVQVSAYGDAYAHGETLARQLTAMLWPAAQGAAADPAGAVASVCPALPVPAGAWARPTTGQLTSGFGLRWGSQHAGVDFAGPRDTPVYAAAAGTVITALPAPVPTATATAASTSRATATSSSSTTALESPPATPISPATPSRQGGRSPRARCSGTRAPPATAPASTCTSRSASTAQPSTPSHGWQSAASTCTPPPPPVDRQRGQPGMNVNIHRRPRAGE